MDLLGMKMNKQQNLKGQNNQCAGCGKLFKSNAAFDKHRTGLYSDSVNADGIVTPANRRCMTTEEMLEIGMAENARGYWVTSLYHGTRFYDVDSELEGDETEVVWKCTNHEEITA
jgi:hypothetical protein